jgi:hypothetical protein
LEKQPVTDQIHSTSLAILNTKVRRDAAGRYNLNDCHRAAGGEKKDGPSYWLATDQAQALISALAGSSDARSDLFEGGTTGKPVVVLNGGRVPGTFVAKELVYAYAMWISPAFHLTVIRAFDGLATGFTVRGHAAQFAPVFRGYMSIAKAIGLDRNQAALAANRATKIAVGFGPLDNLGITHLLAPQQDFLLTPSDIGSRLGGKSGIAVNQMLAERGLQTGHRDAKDRPYWEPTEKGLEFAVVMDTGKKHGDGTPVRQVKWGAGVIRPLREVAA